MMTIIKFIFIYIPLYLLFVVIFGGYFRALEWLPDWGWYIISGIIAIFFATVLDKKIP